MYNKNNVFYKIINKELPASIINENKEFIAFNDINPDAPIHVLAIPKRLIRNIEEVKDDYEFIKKYFQFIYNTIDKLKINNNYSLLTNSGSKAGQIVDHLHFHIKGF